MHIQSIKNYSQNYRMNFKGLFTDRSYQNNGNWLMEYRPYSWEHMSRMAPKQKICIDDSELPDNEEIFSSQRVGHNYINESSKDIFGTVSYYKLMDEENDIMRATITEKPSMNLLESLKVKCKKLDKFLNMKHDAMASMELDFEKNVNNTNFNSKKFYTYADKMESLGFFHTSDTRKKVLEHMKKAFEGVHSNYENLLYEITQYIAIRDSAEIVKHSKKLLKAELEKLERAQRAGKVIDISRRDVKDPNRALWIALQDVEAASGKLVAMCHRTISVKDIIEHIGINTPKEKIQAKAISYVEELMTKRI